jgi:hypothetical protein
MNEGIEFNQFIDKIIIYVDFILFNFTIPSLNFNKKISIIFGLPKYYCFIWLINKSTNLTSKKTLKI